MDQYGINTGNSASPDSPVYHRLAEILPYANKGYVATGAGIHYYGTSPRNAAVLLDKNMHPVDTVDFSYDDPISATYRGYFTQFPNGVVLPSGSLILGRDLFVENPIAGTSGGLRAALVKLNAGTHFQTSKLLIAFDADEDIQHNTLPSLHSLGYNPNDNLIYYSFTDHRNFGPSISCGGSGNFVQVIAADTNLNMKWRKYIVPASSRCAYVTHTAVPEHRTGFDVIGGYNDLFDPGDVSRRGSFVYHVDSVLNVGVSNPGEFELRDRFEVYPNPTANTVSVDDLLGA